MTGWLVQAGLNCQMILCESEVLSPWSGGEPDNEKSVARVLRGRQKPEKNGEP